MSATTTTAPEPAGTVRASRLELVDDEGRVRAVLGPLPTPDPDWPVFGLALVDEGGRARTWLAVDPTGPALVFDLLGNNIISLGVNDPTADALQVGGYLHVSDLDGMPVYGWQVEDDGTVLAQFGRSRR